MLIKPPNTNVCFRCGAATGVQICQACTTNFRNMFNNMYNVSGTGWHSAGSYGGVSGPRQGVVWRTNSPPPRTQDYEEMLFKIIKNLDAETLKYLRDACCGRDSYHYDLLDTEIRYRDREFALRLKALKMRPDNKKAAEEFEKKKEFSDYLNQKYGKGTFRDKRKFP
jgi:hypothetical protein